MKSAAGRRHEHSRVGVCVVSAEESPSLADWHSAGTREPLCSIDGEVDEKLDPPGLFPCDALILRRWGGSECACALVDAGKQQMLVVLVVERMETGAYASICSISGAKRLLLRSQLTRRAGCLCCVDGCGPLLKAAAVGRCWAVIAV